MLDVDLAIRLERVEYALRTMAWWLVQAQTGFGREDARGIDEILDGKRDEAMLRGEPNTDSEPS